MKMIYILFYLNSVDTECQAKDIVSQHDNHLWMWIALFEALCIIVLLFILLISRNQSIFKHNGDLRMKPKREMWILTI